MFQPEIENKFRKDIAFFMLDSEESGKMNKREVTVIYEMPTTEEQEEETAELQRGLRLSRDRDKYEAILDDDPDNSEAREKFLELSDECDDIAARRISVRESIDQYVYAIHGVFDRNGDEMDPRGAGKNAALNHLECAKAVRDGFPSSIEQMQEERKKKSEKYSGKSSRSKRG